MWPRNIKLNSIFLKKFEFLFNFRSQTFNCLPSAISRVTRGWVNNEKLKFELMFNAVNAEAEFTPWPEMRSSCVCWLKSLFSVFCARSFTSPRCQPDIKRTHMCLCPKEHVLQQQRKKEKMNKIIQKNCELKLQINFYYYALSFAVRSRHPATRTVNLNGQKKNATKRETFKKIG